MKYKILIIVLLLMSMGCFYNCSSDRGFSGTWDLEFDGEAFERGERVYNSNCINCHGTPEMEGSIPLSNKFWEQPFKFGNDPFAMYKTITKGSGSMPPQVTLTPQEKYDVILYIRENFVRPDNKGEYYPVSSEYLAQLPEGTTKGPAAKPYHPWSDMDYGNFFINTYESVSYTHLTLPTIYSV